MVAKNNIKVQASPSTIIKVPQISHLNEVINIHELEEAFLSKNKQKVFAILDQLSKVSSMKHILEFLIEFCLKQKSLACLPIW